MALKQFNIPWEGSQEVVEYEDDITFGELENILNKCLDLTDITKPKVNIPLYRQLILQAVIKKAPFEINDTGSIRNLKASTAKIIMKGVMKTYPLMKYLEEWVETFVGDDTISISQVSTTSSQESSVGQNLK
tara:strand:+ start:1511 stop:1906 length:396 start_codon:yes stop_codon:yes gene_type:complete